MSLPVEPLTLADLASSASDDAGPLSLSTLAGWNQTLADWQRLLLDAPQGCFCIRDQGRVIATVTTTRYQRSLGWIGMMLVHPDYRRRGLATRLMRVAIEHLTEQGVCTLRLDATPQGRPLYEQLGFRVLQTWSRCLVADSQIPSVAPAEDLPNSLPAVGTIRLDDRSLALDRQAFGADRSALLTRLAADSQTLIDPGGYAMLRPGRTAWHLGPVIARDPDAAERLVQTLLTPRPGPVMWDMPGDHPSAAGLANRLGFQPIRTLYRMTLRVGEDIPPLFDQPDRIYAFADPALG